MVNEHYDPDAVEDRVIELLRDEHRVNAPRVVDETDCSRADVNHALRNLATAGWCRKVARGLYEYVEDPRVDSDAESAERAETPPESGAVSRARTALAAWQPTDVDTQKARRATVAVVGWLSEQDGPRQKAAIREWYSGEYAFSTAWQKAIRPGLRELVEVGQVRHQRNVGYAIVEEEGRED